MQRITKNYKTYLLVALMVILAFNQSDRIALGLVVENLKADLHLTDAQVGFLSGVAFALFYSVLGIPIARWADRADRVKIIAITTLLWSAAVSLCGVAGSFLQLVLIRVAVGVGEAGCVPPSLSLIADFFTRAERPRAVSFYMQGLTASVVIGYFAAGWLAELYGWRVMFVLLGLPGVALGALAWLTLKEPRRTATPTGLASPHPPSLKEVCVTLWASRTFRHILYAYAVSFFFNFALLQWTPAFLVRSFGLGTGELGTWLSVVYAVSCLIGTYGMGELATRLGDEQRQLKWVAVAFCLCGIFGALVYVPFAAPNYHWAFVWLGLSSVTGMINGPAFAVLQTLVPERMRAMSIALIYFFANLIGMGFGPWAAGALSDALRPWAGGESLRYALIIMSPISLWAAWHLWRASTAVKLELGLARPGFPLEWKTGRSCEDA